MLCIYVSMYVCMHVFICVCMYARVDGNTYTNQTAPPPPTTTKNKEKTTTKKRPGVPTSTGSPCGGGSHATAVHNLRRGRRFFLGRFHFLAHVCVCLEACMSVECVFIMRYRFLGWFLVYAWNARDFVLRFFFRRWNCVCACVRACQHILVRLCSLKFAFHAGGQNSVRACWYPSRARLRDKNPADPKWLRVKGRPR